MLVSPSVRKGGRGRETELRGIDTIPLPWPKNVAEMLLILSTLLCRLLPIKWEMDVKAVSGRLRRLYRNHRKKRSQVLGQQTTDW